MKLTVGEVSKLFDISVRTLHYYDEINLLNPSEKKENGYRYYTDEDLVLLQEIIFYKDLMLPLKDIKYILKQEKRDKVDILNKHKKILMLKREKIDLLIKLVDDTLNGGKTKMNKDNIDKINIYKEEYKKEVLDKWGKTKEYAEYKDKTSSYTKNKWNQIEEETKKIFLLFYNNKNNDVKSNEVKALVRIWKDFISDNFYYCSNDVLLSLSDMYINDERFRNNIDSVGEGTAEFMSRAIKEFVREN